MKILCMAILALGLASIPGCQTVAVKGRVVRADSAPGAVSVVSAQDARYGQM